MIFFFPCGASAKILFNHFLSYEKREKNKTNLIAFSSANRFAAEIFHDLHEEVMATAARGHGLMVRVQQLEAEFPSIEKAFLSQTNHSIFFSNAG